MSSYYKKVRLFAILYLAPLVSFCQDKHLPDYKIPLLEKIGGNSWTIAAANTWARNNFWELSAGRTFGIDRSSGGPEGGPFAISWGVSLADSYTEGHSNPFWGAYIENTNSDFVTGYNIRVEYLQSADGRYRYISPAVGYSFLGVADLCYTFFIPAGSSDNLFKNGVSLRVRLWLNRSNWVQKNNS